jgi:hypothetical protein
MRITSLAQLTDLLQSPNGLITDHSETQMDKLIELAKQIHGNLHKTLKYEFKIDFDTQDRSDFAQIEIPTSMLKDPATKWVEIRLSNMFPLVAISDESKVNASCLEEIKCALEKADCIVVDQNIFFSGETEQTDSRNALNLENTWRSLFDYD